MKSDKKFILIIAIMIIVILILGIYYFSGSKSSGLNGGHSGFDNNSTENSPNNSSSENGGPSSNESTNNQEMTILSLTSVKDYNDFFTINTIINEYYGNLVNNEQSIVLNKLDEDYVKSHNINKSNIKNYMENNYHSISYYATNIYVKGINDIYYYFVSGESQNYNFFEETLDEKEKINYLIIVDNADYTYSITPLDVKDNVFKYAQEYKMKKNNIEFKSDNSIISSTINDEVIMVYYLNYFQTLLYLNTEKAYNMIDPEIRSQFGSYEDFVNNLDSIYSNISTNIFSYSINGKDSQRTYNIIDNKQRKITITEKSIMNFTIKF